VLLENGLKVIKIIMTKPGSINDIYWLGLSVTGE